METKQLTFYLLYVRVELGKHFKGCNCCGDECIVESIDVHSDHIVRIKSSCGWLSYLPKL